VYFYTEYLDLTLFTGDEPRPELRALLRQKYGRVKLDLVVALGSRALRFAVKTAPTCSRARRSSSRASTETRSPT